MKILFIIANFPHQKNPVAGIFYKRTIDELVSRGHQVTVIAPINLAKIFFTMNLKIKSEEQSDLLKIYRPYFLSLKFEIFDFLKLFSIKFVVKNTIKKYTIDFDIIDSRYLFPWSAVASYISTKFNKPFIAVAIGDDINTDIYQSSYKRKITREILNNSSCVIAVSENIRDIIEKEFNLSNVVVVYDGIDFSSFYLKDFKRLSGTSKLTIGFVGYVAKEKGCDILLRIIQSSKDKYNWIVVGEGPLKNQFQRHAHVKVTGNLPFHEVQDYFNQMDLFLFPTQNEGIPNVLKEAAFFEIPIITTNVGGIPELIMENKNAILLDLNSKDEEFLNAIEKIEKEADKYLFSAKSFKEHVLRRFSSQQNIDMLLNIYSKALSITKFN